jgi:hypothetical protein
MYQQKPFIIIILILCLCILLYIITTNSCNNINSDKNYECNNIENFGATIDYNALPSNIKNVVAWYNPNNFSNTGWTEPINSIHLNNLSGDYLKDNNLIKFQSNTTYMKSTNSTTIKAFVCLIIPLNNNSDGNNSMLFTINGPNNDLSFRKSLVFEEHDGNDVNNPSEIYINGVQTTTYNNTNKSTILTVIFKTTQTTTVCLGSTFMNRGYIGRIGDFICLGPYHTYSDIKTAEGFIAWKYSLQSNLPIKHPYYYVNPMRADNNFFPLPLLVYDSVVALYNPILYDISTGIWKDTINNIDLSANNITDITKINTYVNLNTNTSYLLSNTSSQVRIKAFVCLIKPFYNSSVVNNNYMLFTINGPNNDLSFRRSLGFENHNDNDVNDPDYIYINGVQTKSYDNKNKYTILSVIFKSEQKTTICIGSTFMSRGYIGYIGDFICLGSNYSLGAIKSAEGYIAWKYNLTTNLLSSHPYYSINPLLYDYLPRSLNTVIAWYNPLKCTNSSWFDNINNIDLINNSKTIEFIYRDSFPFKLINFTSSTTYLLSSKTITMKAFVCLIYPIYNSSVGNNSMLFTINGPNNDLSFRKPFFNQDHNGNDVNDPNQIYINGTKSTAYANNNKYTILSIIFNTEQTTTVCLGSTFMNRGYTGYIGDFICLNPNFTLNDIRLAEGYIAWKWGLYSNLPLSHPWRFIKPN